MELPLSDLAHGDENVLVVAVPEPKATGPDLVLLQAGPGQRFDMVRLGNPGVEGSVSEQKDLADRSDAMPVF